MSISKMSNRAGSYPSSSLPLSPASFLPASRRDTRGAKGGATRLVSDPAGQRLGWSVSQQIQGFAGPAGTPGEGAGHPSAGGGGRALPGAAPLWALRGRETLPAWGWGGTGRRPQRERERGLSPKRVTLPGGTPAGSCQRPRGGAGPDLWGSHAGNTPPQRARRSPAAEGPTAPQPGRHRTFL